MASQPLPETPAPSTPMQPDSPPPEIQTPAPDTDYPDTMPGGMPGTSEPQPMGFAMPEGGNGATSSSVGTSDDEKIGSTDGMTASTGGMAGTSR